MESERAKLFLHFLDKVSKEKGVTHFFLLGDIFDFWIGKKKIFIQKYHKIIEALKLLRDRGVEIHYFEGNHDLHLKPFWEKELLFFVHERPIHFNLGHLRLRLEHGDQINPRQYFYLFWRWLIHRALIRFLVLKLPDKVLFYFGRKLGQKSRSYSDKKKLLTSKMRIQMKKCIQRSIHLKPFDLFISGHFHLQDDHVFKIKGQEVRSLNLGTWLNNSSPVAFRFTSSSQHFVKILP